MTRYASMLAKVTGKDYCTIGTSPRSSSRRMNIATTPSRSCISVPLGHVRTGQSRTYRMIGIRPLYVGDQPSTSIFTVNFCAKLPLGSAGRMRYNQRSLLRSILSGQSKGTDLCGTLAQAPS